jgi:hypothetical protein
MHLRFVASESAFDYFRATASRHGKPLAFYSDKHGIFRVNAKDAAGGEPPVLHVEVFDYHAERRTNPEPTPMTAPSRRRTEEQKNRF